MNNIEFLLNEVRKIGIELNDKRNIERCEITKESFVADIQSYISIEEPDTQVSEKSLGDDFDCIIKTYLPSEKSISPESNLECPLTTLGLISLSDEKTKTYTKTATGYC